MTSNSEPSSSTARACLGASVIRARNAAALLPSNARRQAMMRLTAVAAAAVFLAGCASFSSDGGFGKVAELTKERTGQTPKYQRSAADTDGAEARSAELLKQPL